MMRIGGSYTGYQRSIVARGYNAGRNHFANKQVAPDSKIARKKLRLCSASSWMDEVRKQGNDFECEVCVQERARRRRVLPAEKKPGEDQ